MQLIFYIWKDMESTISSKIDVIVCACFKFNGTMLLLFAVCIKLDDNI